MGQCDSGNEGSLPGLGRSTIRASLMETGRVPESNMCWNTSLDLGTKSSLN